MQSSAIRKCVLIKWVKTDNKYLISRQTFATKMEVLVTGGTGHLGSWLVKILCNQGIKVRVLCKQPDKVKHLEFNGVKLIQGNVVDFNSVLNAAKGVTQIFHLAAYTKLTANSPELYQDINVTGSKNVLEAAMKLEVKRVVMVSSAGNLGHNFGKEINENTVRTHAFFNEYERTKSASDEITNEYFNKGLDVVTVMPTRVFGPVLHGKPASVTLLLNRIVKANFRFVPFRGEAIGNYIYVEDVADGIIKAMEKGKSGEKYILGGENRPLLDLYTESYRYLNRHIRLLFFPKWLIQLWLKLEELFSVFGRAPRITHDWMAKLEYSWIINSQKAEMELGYKKTKFEIGIAKTIDSILQRKK